ncbi:NAD(P)-binding domain-containing protein [Nonomuraea sp. B12E4]|uniref:NAD(P)-binding domain-containing protein n=1 Tax=Nonomuraea sp. B12E4 TaxID=3153564 RepID=UPI00325DE0E2
MAAELGPRASAATSGEAAAAGDIVVITVPVNAFPHVPAAPLAGKTVIDTCNYGPERDGPIPELDSKSLISSELLPAPPPATTVRRSPSTGTPSRSSARNGGRVPRGWGRCTQRDTEAIVVKFSGEVCRPCPVRSWCASAKKGGRRLTIRACPLQPPWPP